MMVWLILIIAGIITGIFICRYECTGVSTMFAVCPLMAMVFVMAGLLLSLAITAIAEPPYETTTINTTEIIALRDNTETEGVFCIRGQIDEKPVYTVLVKTPMGLQTVVYQADVSYVQFTDGSPRVETIKQTATGAWPWWFGQIWFEKTRYIMYIPQDSEVANDFVVDLE